MMLALLIPLMFAQDSELIIDLPRESRAYGTEIELGEIATVSGGTPAQLASAKALELGYVPAPGYSRVLRSDRILTLFERKLPGVKVRITGEGATRIYPAITKVKGAEVLAAARAQLLVRFDSTEVSFQSRTTVNDIEIPQGTSKHEIKARLESAPSRSGFLNIPVDIHVDGQRFRTIWTGWDVVVWDTRNVLARDLKEGEVIRPQDLERQRIPVGLNAPRTVNPKLLPGAVATHDMLKGSLVKPMDVVRPRVVKPQDLLRLKVKSGGITASVMAASLSSGAVGDRIRVRTLDKNIELTATIQSRDLCVLTLGN